MDDRDKRHMGIMPDRPYKRQRRWRRRRGYGQRSGGGRHRRRGRHSRAALIGAVVTAIVAATAITAVAMTMGPDWVRQYEEDQAIATAERQANRVADIHRLTNEVRVDHGIPPLRQDPALDAIAQAHADDMVERNYFNHDTPEGLGPSDRAAMAGYGCGGPYIGVGENLAEGGDHPTRAIGMWLDSPGHRANILNPSYTHLGVGVAAEYPYPAVQKFC